jgi:uncharacterized protein
MGNAISSARLEWAKRILVYATGLLTLAMGVSLSTITGLGISPLNVLAFVVSQISGVKMGYATMGIFALYILIELAIKGRDFRSIDLLQFAVAVLFGYFVNWTKAMVAGVAVTSYAIRMLLTLASTCLIALGTTLYVSAGIVPQAPEGLILSICRRWGLRFSSVKEGFDVTSVAIAAAVSLAFERRIIGVREGTLVMAILVGVVVSFLGKGFRPRVERFCFGERGGTH